MQFFISQHKKLIGYKNIKMSSNLIFHAVSKRNWNEFNKGGFYNPEGSKYDDGIVCVNANKLKDYINQNFKGRRQVLVLVIDKLRLIPKTVYEKEKQIYLIKDRINMDAILDKIYVKPNEEGVFDIEITED
jgi:uncharacterized protein (DUF952 family)